MPGHEGLAASPRYDAPVIYLDNNATTRPADDVVDAMRDALREHWQNPSSIHRAGQSARRIVEQSRASVARLIGARPRQIAFTSGGTEAIDWAIRGFLEVGARRGRTAIVTSHLEHNAVRDLAMHLEERAEAEIRWAPATRDGRIDINALRDLLDESVALVCAQWANNETGVIQPIEVVGALSREAGAFFLCDGTQWVGKMPTNVERAPFDALTFAPHKFHGPKGIGALWLRRGVTIPPRLHGAQESGRRGGTENVPGVVGFGVAAEIAMRWIADESKRSHIAALRDRLEQGVLKRVPDALVNGAGSGGTGVSPVMDNQPCPCERGHATHESAVNSGTGVPPVHRLWNTTNIGFPRLESEALLIALSERGVCASAGAACSSGSLEPSPVLLAMNIPEEIAHGSLRFSLSRETTDDEIEQAIDIIADSVQRLRASSEALAR